MRRIRESIARGHGTPPLVVEEGHPLDSYAKGVDESKSRKAKKRANKTIHRAKRGVTIVLPNVKELDI